MTLIDMVIGKYEHKPEDCVSVAIDSNFRAYSWGKNDKG